MKNETSLSEVSVLGGRGQPVNILESQFIEKTKKARAFYRPGFLIVNTIKLK